MEKINYHKQEHDLASGLVRLIESARRSRVPCRQAGRVTQPATGKQLGLLSRLGIRPKWKATRIEAEEMIMHYKLIVESANRRPL